MKKIIRITKSQEIVTFYGPYHTEEVHYRNTEAEALEYIRSEFAKDFYNKDFKIEHVDFDNEDKLSINALTKGRKEIWKK